MVFASSSSIVIVIVDVNVDVPLKGARTGQGSCIDIVFKIQYYAHNVNYTGVAIEMSSQLCCHICYFSITIR